MLQVFRTDTLPAEKALEDAKLAGQCCDVQISVNEQFYGEVATDVARAMAAHMTGQQSGIT